MKRNLFLILFLAMMLGMFTALWADITVTLGEGTTTNTATTPPTPYGTYFKNFRQQYLIFADELFALGAGGGNINAIAFNVQAVNNCVEMPNFRIKMKHTDLTAFTTTFELGDYQQVWYSANFLPVEGWNTHTFTTPFNWDGSSNIIVEIVTSLIPGAYTQNASVYFTATTGINTSLRYQHDTTEADTSTTGVLTVSRANMQITMQAGAEDDMAAVNITGPQIVYIDQPANYTVTVKNMGSNNQNNYTVKLMGEGAVELDFEIVTVSLDFLEETEVILSWTPLTGSEGDTFIYGKVVLVDDENAANDETDPYDVFVIGATVSVFGFINSNDSPFGYSGADIYLTGIDDYQLLDSPSSWQIDGVIMNSSYTLTVEADGYETYTTTINVGEENYDAGTITLLEETEPVYNVTAELINNDTEVEINWNTYSTYLYFSDFEEDNGGWVPTATWNPVGDWEWTNTYDVGNWYVTDSASATPPPTAHSGTGFWGTVINTNHTNSGGFNYLTQTFNFTGQTDTQLIFWSWNDLFGNFDYGQVRVNGDIVYGPAWDYTGTTWQEIIIDLSDYDGLSEVIIQFEMYATTVVAYAGWYIDDVYIGPIENVPTRDTVAFNSRAFLGYNVYRLFRGDETEPLLWDQLNTVTVADTTFIDADWLDAEDGFHRWAVRSVYSGNLLSNPAFSNIIPLRLPFIVIDPTALNFGSVIINEDGEATLTIYNNGDGNLIGDFTLPAEITAAPETFNILPDGELLVTFTINYGVLGEYTDTIVINSNDWDHPTVNLPVTAFISLSPMSGTFTIDHTGNGDYDSFTDAVEALILSGLAGPVVFEVVPGIYNEQFVIPSIPNASEVNTITFTKLEGVRQEAVLIFSPTLTSARHIVKLVGARHVRFNNLTFTIGDGATYGHCFHIQNESYDIEITNNIMNNYVAATSTFYVHIIGSATDVWGGAGNTVNNILIEGNTFNDGYAAIRLNGAATTRLTGVEIRDNIFDNQYYHGIYFSQLHAPVIEENLINIRSVAPTTTLGAGIYLDNAHGPFLVSKNNINNPGQYGIYLSNGSTDPTERSRIVNNSVGGGFRNTGSLGGPLRILGTVNNLDIFYNSFNSDFGNNSGMYIAVTSVTGLDIRNNSFAYTGGGTGYAFYMSSTGTPITLDYNNYYSNGSNFVYYGTALANLAALQAVNIPVGNDQNSRAGDPGYLSNTNLYPEGVQLWQAAIPIAGIIDDIEGTLRDEEFPCIGAYEFEVPQNDLAAVAIAGPGTAYIGELATYTVTVRNVGMVTQDSYTVKLMKAGDIELASLLVTVSLATDQTVDVDLDWTPAAEEVTFVYGQVFLNLDENTANDTTDILEVVVVSDALEGIYSINWDGTGNFLNFSEALLSLYAAGISGPVTFQVSPGTYEEQILFNGEIAGASETNTVTFTGLDDVRQDAVLQFAPSDTNNRYVVRLQNGAKYLRFNNLTIKAIEPATHGFTFHILSGSQNIEITNCWISTIDTSTSSFYIPIVISGSETSYITGASNISDILFENNTVIGGYNGISYRGVGAADTILGVQVLNNEILDAYYYGIYSYYATAPVIKYNTINMRSEGTTTTFGSGVYLYYNYDGVELAYNTITNPGQYGVYCLYVSGSETNQNLIYNNMIGGGFRNTGTLASGIYMGTATSYFQIYYNSINVDLGTGAAIYATTGLTNLRALNNSFAYTGPGNGRAAYYAGTASLIEHDYNNFFAGSSSLFVYFGTAIADLATLQGLGWDLNSYVGDPLYVSPTDLHAQGTQLYQRGTPILGIDDDIDGDERDPVNPCIGADEYTPLTDDLAAVVINGPTVTSLDVVNEYTITVFNAGTSVQNAYTVQLLLAGDDTLLDFVNVADALPSGQATSHILTWLTTTGGEFQIYGRVILAGDQNTDNDTTSLLTVNVIAPNTVYPFFENFDAVTAPTMPIGWVVENTNADTAFWRTYATNPFSAPNAVYCNWNSTMAADDWFFTSPLYLTAGVDYNVSFMYRAHSATYLERLKVHLGSSPESISMDPTPIFNHIDFNHTAYIEGTAVLTVAESGVYYLGWHKYSIANQWGIYVDDILIDAEIGVLDAPIVSIEIVAGNIILDWDPVEGANSYYIYASDEPFTLDWGLPIAQVGVPGYMEAVDGMKFYKVVASSDALPGRGITPLTTPRGTRR